MRGDEVQKWDRGAMRGAPPGRHRNDRLGLLTPGLRLEQVRGGRRLRRAFEIWWQGVLVGRLGFTVFRKPGIGATGDWTVGALKKGWEKLQARRGFGVWKGLMRQGRELRAAGWWWFDPKLGFFPAGDEEEGYRRRLRTKYD